MQQVDIDDDDDDVPGRGGREAASLSDGRGDSPPRNSPTKLQKTGKEM